jgi:hypothetical protein
MEKKTFHVLDFEECTSVIKFLDKCLACAKHGKKCKYRLMLAQVLLGKAKIDYEMILEEKSYC